MKNSLHDPLLPVDLRILDQKNHALIAQSKIAVSFLVSLLIKYTFFQFENEYFSKNWFAIPLESYPYSNTVPTSYHELHRAAQIMI